MKKSKNKLILILAIILIMLVIIGLVADARYQVDESKKVYAFLLDKNNAEEIKNGLLEIFSTDKPSKIHWNQLSKLLCKVYDNKCFEEAIKLLSDDTYSLAVGSKVKHFINMYDELVFNINYQKQMEEYSEDFT